MQWSRPAGFLAATCLAAACANQVANPFVSSGAGGGGFGGALGVGGFAGQGGVGGASGSGATGSSHHAGAGVTSGTAAGGTGGVPATCLHQSDCAAQNDACNYGSCLNNTCVQMPMNDGGPCDDGLFCTESDTCQQGFCSGTPRYCPPSDSCHVGTCLEALKACAQTPGNDGTFCAGNGPCFNGGSCSNGTCVPGPTVECGVLADTCNVGVCDPAQGCVQEPSNEGGPCTPGLFCAVDGTCKNGVCAGTPNLCGGPPKDPCLDAVCDELARLCTTTPGNDGAACPNPNTCLVTSTCSDGVCSGGVPGNEGSSCSDGDKCDVGTTCSAGVCGNPTLVITACVSGDGCCPPGCTGANDGDCLYWQPGVLSNVDPAILSGWTSCYTDTYAVALASTLNTVTTQCSKGKLLLACRPVGASTFTLAAMGLRADVLFDCGNSNTCTHQANGVGWYFSATWSWGFVSGSDPVARNECDTDLSPNANLRLCWHTIPAVGGYRCGATSGLNSDAAWERDVFQAD